MSFNPPTKKSGGASPADPPLPFLQNGQKPLSNIADPAKAERAFDEARRKTLRTLNAIKIVAPVLSAVIEKHGAGGSEEESIATFKRLISQSSEMSEFVIKELGEDPHLPANFWLRNMLERTFCEVLKDQHQRGKDTGLRSMEPVLREIAKMEWAGADGAQEFETWAPDTVVRASLLRASAPIMIKAAGFDFFRVDFGKDLEAIMRRLMGAASRATLAMADASSGEKEKASLFAVLIGEAGALYASAWHVCGKQMVANLSSLNDKELTELLSKNPEGLPLEKIDEAFERNFSRLVALSTKLVPQKPGRMEARLKAPENT